MFHFHFQNLKLVSKISVQGQAQFLVGKSFRSRNLLNSAAWRTIVHAWTFSAFSCVSHKSVGHLRKTDEVILFLHFHCTNCFSALQKLKTSNFIHVALFSKIKVIFACLLIKTLLGVLIDGLGFPWWWNLGVSAVMQHVIGRGWKFTLSQTAVANRNNK